MNACSNKNLANDLNGIVNNLKQTNKRKRRNRDESFDASKKKKTSTNHDTHPYIKK